MVTRSASTDGVVCEDDDKDDEKEEADEAIGDVDVSEDSDDEDVDVDVEDDAIPLLACRASLTFPTTPLFPTPTPRLAASPFSPALAPSATVAIPTWLLILKYRS